MEEGDAPIDLTNVRVKWAWSENPAKYAHLVSEEPLINSLKASCSLCQRI